MTDRSPRNEGNTLPEIQDALSKIDTGQDALIESSITLQHQNAVIITLLDQLVALITPKEGQQEGPRLDELLARMIAQQTMIIDLSKRTVDSVTRIESFLKDPRPAADNLHGARTPC